MAVKNTGGVKKFSKNSYKVEFKLPPSLYTSNASRCNVVKIWYTLEVEAEVSGCHGNIAIKFPITIGSIPLAFDAPQPTTTQQILPTAPTEGVSMPFEIRKLMMFFILNYFNNFL